MFVIEPVIFFRKPDDWPWSSVKRMTAGTKFSSDTNPLWLTQDELRTMVNDFTGDQ